MAFISSAAMSLFAWTLFPLAFALLGLLILPLPDSIRKHIIAFIDAVLFFEVPGLGGVSLFWFVTALSAFVLAASYIEWDAAMDKDPDAAGTSDLREKLLKKQFKSEKNLWMAAFAFTLYVTIHRYRHDVKASINAKQSGGAAAEKKTA
jgi:hypothetical protein